MATKNYLDLTGLGHFLEKLDTRYATSSHKHPLSITTSSGTNQLTLSAGTKYSLTAGGNSFIFTTPSTPTNVDKVDGLHMLDQTYAYTGYLEIEIGCVNAVVKTGKTEAQIFALTGNLYGQLYLASDTGKYWRRKNTATTASADNWRDDTSVATASLALPNQLTTTEDAVYVRIDLKQKYYSKLVKFFVEAGYDNISGSTSITTFCRQQNQFEITSCSYNGNNLTGIYQPTGNTDLYVFRFGKFRSSYGAVSQLTIKPKIYYNQYSGTPTLTYIGSSHSDYNTVKAYSYVTVPTYGILGTNIYYSTLPVANNTYNLGSSSYKWNNLYLGNNLTDGTHSITVANIVGKYTKPSDGIPASDLAESYYLASNPSGYITSTALSNYVTLDGTQTISGQKTFTAARLYISSETHFTSGGNPTDYAYGQSVGIFGNAMMCNSLYVPQFKYRTSAMNTAGKSATIWNLPYLDSGETYTLATTDDIPTVPTTYLKSATVGGTTAAPNNQLTITDVSNNSITFSPESVKLQDFVENQTADANNKTINLNLSPYNKAGTWYTVASATIAKMVNSAGNVSSGECMLETRPLGSTAYTYQIFTYKSGTTFVIWQRVQNNTNNWGSWYPAPLSVPGNTAGTAISTDDTQYIASITTNGRNLYRTSFKGTSSSTNWDSASDVNIPTMKSISSYVTGLGYTSNVGTVTSVNSVSPTDGNVSLTYANINAGNITLGDGANYMLYRTHESYRAGYYYHTTGDESVVFANKYNRAGWIFAVADPTNRTNWQSLTPTLQIKDGGVAINKLIGQGVTPTYKLDVNGSANATSIYENGTDISTKYYLASNPNGYTTNKGTVTSVSAGTGLNISGTSSVNPTVNIANNYKLPTTTEWNGMAELAEGKSQAYTLAYDPSDPGGTFNNSVFNSQNDTIIISNSNTLYISGGKITGPQLVSAMNLKIGDVIYVTNTDVPDRWVGAINSGSYMLYKMETSKPDLSSYVTTNTEQTISGQKTFSSTNTYISGCGFSKSDNLLSDTNPAAMRALGSNPFFGLRCNSTNYYLQATSAGLYLGPTSTVATSWDASGNITIRGTVQPKWGTKTLATTDDIPSAVTESTVSGWGFTKNTGTVTSVSAGTGLSISGTASTTPTVNIASGYKLLTSTEWQNDSVYSVMSLSTVAGSSTSGSVKSVRWYVSGVEGITTPYNGMKLAVKIPLAGVSTGGVILSINGNNDADYHPVAYNVNTVFTTHYGVGTIKYLTYDANQTMACYKTTGTSVTITGVWKFDADYDSNTTITYGTVEYYFRPYVGTQALYRYKLVMQDKDNRLVPLTITNVSNGTAVTNQTPTNVAFKPDKIWFYAATSTINAGAVVGGQVLWRSGYNANNSTNGGMAVCNFNSTISAYRMLYLCGTYNKTTGLFSLRGGGTASSTQYYTQVPTNTANITLSSYFTSGYDYILVGGTYSSNNYIQLFDNNPMYHFDGTNLVPYDTYNENRIENLNTSDVYYYHILHYDNIMFNGQSAPYTGDLPFISTNFQPCIVIGDITVYTNKVIKNLFDNGIYYSSAQASLGEWTFMGDDSKYEVLSFNQSTGELHLRNNSTLTDVTLNLRDVSSISMVYTDDNSITNGKALMPNTYDGDTWMIEGSDNYVKSINGSTGAITNVAKTNNNIIPTVNSTSSSTGYSLGSTSYYWNYLHVREINAKGDITCGGSLKKGGSTFTLPSSSGTLARLEDISSGGTQLYQHLFMDSNYSYAYIISDQSTAFSWDSAYNGMYVTKRIITCWIYDNTSGTSWWAYPRDYQGHDNHWAIQELYACDGGYTFYFDDTMSDTVTAI